MGKNFNILMLCLLGILVTAAGGCVNIGGFGPRAKYKKTIKLQAPLEAGSTLKAQTSYGSITVQGADVSDCNVIAKICVQAPTEAEASEIAEQIKIYLEPNGKTLTIKADKPHVKNNRSISICYQITVPEQTSIECNSSYGALKLNNLNGNVNAHTSYGSINCTNIDGQIRLNTSYGHVDCGSIISDELKVHSSYGNISVGYSEKASAQIRAEISTSYGSIGFTAPPEFTGQVELATSHGSIKTDLPITVKGKISNKRINGTIGKGNGMLNLKTSFGSIKIK